MQVITYRHAENFYLCNQPLPRGWTNDKTQIKVRDHDHMTGLYRGPAHSICNLQLRINPKRVRIPIVFHNLKGYDSHIIILAIEKHHGNVTCIPSNSINSLDKLSKILESGKFKQVRRFLESKYVNDENHDFQAETFEEGETHTTADEELSC